MVRVRKAVESDIEAVRAVGFATWPPTYVPLFGDEYVERGLAQWWDDPSVRRQITAGATYVVEEDGPGPGVEAAGSDVPDSDVPDSDVPDSDGAGIQVIGVAVIGRLDEVPFLWKLYVVPGQQGTGAGKALLDAVIADLPPTAEKLWLDHAEGNDQAHGFYESQGFHELFRHEEELGHREVRMERLLR